MAQQRYGELFEYASCTSDGTKTVFEGVRVCKRISPFINEATPVTGVVADAADGSLVFTTLSPCYGGFAGADACVHGYDLAGKVTYTFVVRDVRDVRDV